MSSVRTLPPAASLSARDFGEFSSDCGLLFDESNILGNQHTPGQLKQFALPPPSHLWGPHSLSAPSVSLPPTHANLQKAKAGIGWGSRETVLLMVLGVVHQEK